MAHEVESMFFVGETPWHRLGKKLEAPPTTRDAMVAAGLDWEVGLRPLFTADGDEVSHRATYRTSDGAVLGVVGPAYVPLQNAQAFDFFDPIIQAGEATLETAGSLRGGKRVWVLARISREPSVIVKQADDVVAKYVLLSNSHDGTLAVRVGFTPIRVVCANTLSMALTDAESKRGASKLVRIRHQKNVVDTLGAVRDVMNVANAAFEATATQYRRLAATPVHGDDLKRFVAQVFAPRRLAKAATKEAAPAPMVRDWTDDLADRVDLTATHAGFSADLNEVLAETEKVLAVRSFDAISELFENGKGNALPGVKGTLWAAYNAVTEYTSHQRGRDDEARANALFNDGATINQRALTAALAMAR